MTAPASSRFPLAVAAAAASALGIGFMVWAAAITPARVRLMERYVRDTQGVRDLRADLRIKLEPALATLATLPRERGPSVADLHRQVAGEEGVPDMAAAGDKAVAPQWVLRRQQATYASVAPETLGRLIEACAGVYPPWRLAEARVDALDGEARAVRAVLVFERPERVEAPVAGPPAGAAAPARPTPADGGPAP